MLDSFYIKNFRLFKELKVKTLGRVNLITGKNNSGKSCFLEALRVYAGNASPQLLASLIRERGQDWAMELKRKTSAENQIIEEIENPLRHLFHGYQFPEINGAHLKIGSLNDEHDSIKLSTVLYQEMETETGAVFSRVENSLFDTNISSTEIVIEIDQNFKKRPLIRLNKDIKEYIRPHIFSRLGEKIEPKLRVQFVPTRHLDDDVTSSLWDRANIKPNLRNEIFNALRLIDPKIQELVIIRSSTPIVIYNNEMQIPLRSLGDGAIHLFHIILALVNAKDGMLLIDEFENGLHYSVQPKIWEVIFKLAETLNIQVFATTHSRDCIRAFHEVWSKQENNNKGCFFRLDHYPEKDIIRPMFYDLEALGDSFDVNGEMR